LTDDTTFQERLSPTLMSMYDKPLPSTRTGALYNAFSYPTKISPEAIALFIATHTEVGATVADVFAGSGTTGVAAILCARPTPGMIAEAARLGVQPHWGPRNAHLFDVGVLGAFISGVLTNPPEPLEFKDAVERLLKDARCRLAEAYQAADPNEQPGLIRHVIWSEVVACPHCDVELRLWDIAAMRDPARFAKSFTCKACGSTQKIDDCERIVDAERDVFGRVVTSRRRVPVEIHGITGSKKWVRPATEEDALIASEAASRSLPESAPQAELQWGELYRSGYHTGITHLHHFYTPRNFLAIATCMDLANEHPEPMRSALKFLILSYNSSHSTLMTRIVAKRDQRDFVLTGAQSGVLYVSGLPVEKNVLIGIARKAGTIADAFAMTHGSASVVTVHNISSERLPLAEGSIDYVFTDPPFGDYIPYGEINQINELWLGRTTNLAAETVVSVTGGKSVDDYQRSMSAVFTEVNRVLKPTGRLTVVFHSAHARIWRALTESFAAARLRIRVTSVLDKVQASFKQVVANVSVKGDPLILLDKSPFEAGNVLHSTIIDDLLATAGSASASDIRALYSTYAAKCLVAGHEIELDAADFTRIARATPGRAA
jgi:16S rRNA G966 N2-methylase RsmD